MHFYPTERIALFIDGANLYATAKALSTNCQPHLFQLKNCLMLE